MNLKMQAEELRRQFDFLVQQVPELREDEDLRLGTYEGETNVIEVLTDLHRYREDTRALVEGSQERMEELAARKRRLGARVDMLAKLMQSIMLHAEFKKVELAEVTLSLRANQQALHIDEESIPDLPVDLVRTKIEPDRKKIREAILGGRNVPGSVLVDVPPSVSVRVK